MDFGVISLLNMGMTTLLEPRPRPEMKRKAQNVAKEPVLIVWTRAPMQKMIELPTSDHLRPNRRVIGQMRKHDKNAPSCCRLFASDVKRVAEVLPYPKSLSKDCKVKTPPVLDQHVIMAGRDTGHCNGTRPF